MGIDLTSFSGVTIRELEPRELGRIREIDRSETSRFVYVLEANELRRIEANLDVPTWDGAAVEDATARLAPKLAAGGVLLGAFDCPRLVGVAVLGGEWVGVDPRQRELAFLHVSATDRCRGLAKQLTDALCRHAQRAGAKQLYISASDTESAIGFYLGFGCRVAERVDPAIAAENAPTDIPLILDVDEWAKRRGGPAGAPGSTSFDSSALGFPARR
jgi:ribosomal protein S18 acetylase RimI-like enzyme